MNFKDDQNFKKAWATMEASGYMYGDDAIENVYFGWKLRNNEFATIRYNYDADMEIAKKHLKDMALTLQKNGELRLTLLREKLELENILRRAFEVHPNLDLDMQQ